IADAGATGVTVLPLHLRTGAKEWFAAWLRREHPELVDTYRAIYGRGSYVDRRYRRLLADRVGPLLRRHGLAPKEDDVAASSNQETGDAVWPAGSLPAGTRAPAAVDQDQLSLM
ncbi:MAG TPA: radical SAM protein, partial [Pseudonocardiaceae bacterium]